MEIQKPTVLDAARLANELAGFEKSVIEEAFYDHEQARLRLAFGNKKTLMYAVEPRFVWLGLIEKSPKKSTGAMRQITGSKLVGASQIGGDRIVALDLEKEDRLGRVKKIRLIIELIPKHGNAILIDENRVIKWTLRKKTPGEYTPPPPLKKATVFTYNRDDFVARGIQTNDLKDQLYGLSDRDLINLDLEQYSAIGKALDAIDYYVNRAAAPGHAWVIFSGDDTIGYSLVDPILRPGERAERFQSALEMYERYYAIVHSQETTRDRIKILLGLLEKELAREKGKLSSLKRELSDAHNAGLYKKQGELLLANIDSIPRGVTAIRLRDFEGNVNFDIELDPSKTASANAESYFKKYRKAISSTKLLILRIDSAEKKVAVLEGLKKISEGDPDALESELVKLNLMRSQSPAKLRTAIAPRLPYKKFVSSSGWEILIGRTNKDNDELTFKIAGREDYWFHAWQAAGSHTVLRVPQKGAIPDKQTLLESAALAAYFSKARTSSKVPVAYTQVKFVHKPKKFPPGRVLVEREKQLMVKPADPELFQKFESNGR